MIFFCMFLYIGIVNNGYRFKSLLVYELIVSYISIDFVKYSLGVCMFSILMN